MTDETSDLSWRERYPEFAAWLDRDPNADDVVGRMIDTGASSWMMWTEEQREWYLSQAEVALHAASAVTPRGEPSDAQEAVRRLKESGVGAYMILAAVTKVYDMETKP